MLSLGSRRLWKRALQSTARRPSRRSGTTFSKSYPYHGTLLLASDSLHAIQGPVSMQALKLCPLPLETWMKIALSRFSSCVRRSRRVLGTQGRAQQLSRLARRLRRSRCRHRCQSRSRRRSGHRSLPLTTRRRMTVAERASMTWRSTGMKRKRLQALLLASRQRHWQVRVEPVLVSIC